MKGFLVTSSLGTGLGCGKQRAGLGIYLGNREFSIMFGEQKQIIKELGEVHEGLVAIALVFDSVENAKKACGDRVEGLSVTLCEGEEGNGAN